MTLATAKDCLDTVIKKARAHLYKPVQIAEILYRDRTEGNITLADLQTYRTRSRAWRDAVSNRLVGNHSTSSARYQDDVFNENACPPEALVALGKWNRDRGGIVEAYIYAHIAKKHAQLSKAMEQLRQSNFSSRIARAPENPLHRGSPTSQ
jgi:type II restriction enzyme